MFRFPRSFGRPFVVAAVSSVATAVAVGGVAVAAGSSSPNVIQACVNKGSGTVRVVADAAACNSNETALSWNQEGPAGAVGTQGPAGPTGAQGPSGPSGPQGPAGQDGATGATGPQGAAGPAGKDGDSGAREVRINVNDGASFSPPYDMGSYSSTTACSGKWLALGNQCNPRAGNVYTEAGGSYYVDAGTVYATGQEVHYTTHLDSGDFPAATQVTLTATGWVRNQSELCARLINADSGIPVEGSTGCFSATGDAPGYGATGKLTATFDLPAGAHTYAVQFETDTVNASLRRIDLRLHW